MLREGVCQSGACPCRRPKSPRAPHSSGHDPHILQLEQVPRGLPCCGLAKGRPGAEHPRVSREREPRSNPLFLSPGPCCKRGCVLPCIGQCAACRLPRPSMHRGRFCYTALLLGLRTMPDGDAHARLHSRAAANPSQFSGAPVTAPRAPAHPGPGGMMHGQLGGVGLKIALNYSSGKGLPGGCA